MRHRTFIAIAIAAVLTFGVTALWSAEGDEREGDTAANIISANEAPTGEADPVAPKKKKGNRFARFLKAPFKAVGKLFDGGDDDRSRPARLTEDDVKRFESVGVLRVEEKRGGEERTPTATPTTARNYLDEGRARLAEGEMNAAIAALSRAASLDPRLAEAQSLLAVAYDRKGLHERAREAHERAIDLNQTDAQALNNLGWSLYLSGNYRAAVDRLKRAARLAPTDARIFNNLGLAQCRLGKYDDAFKSFSRHGGEFNARMNVGSLLERAGRDHEAIKHYEQAQKLQPGSIDLQRRLSSLYVRASRNTHADAVRFAVDQTVKRDDRMSLALKQ
ncbi:MAG TPA: tetratricopeptide repeat protein [Pyrinomonadaceae bacterium]|jgi:Tfp pilus assembly protein PilF